MPVSQRKLFTFRFAYGILLAGYLVEKHDICRAPRRRSVYICQGGVPVDTIMKIENITKKYPGVLALDNVSFEIKRGEVHALMGENGAGKSTLIKVISGAIAPDSGRICFEGQTYQKMTTALSSSLGISVIYQEFNLVPSMSVLENMFLGQKVGSRIGPDRKKMRALALDAFRQLGVTINPDVMVSSLSTAQQQIVEIARSLCHDLKLIFMDEPTATLAMAETRRLFSIINKLRSQGITIIYISHRMEEVFELADSITILRDGRHINTCPMAGLERKDIIRMMVGRELNESYPTRNVAIGEPVLELDRLSGNGDHDISFTLHRGEILGLAGLIGAGRTELAKLIYGAAKRTGGAMRVKGVEVHPRTPGQALKLGIGLIPESRKTEGVFLDFSIRWNINIQALPLKSKFSVMDKKALAEQAAEMEKRFSIKTPSLDQLVKNLSGGNQQKTALAKAIAADTDIIIFDEPTRGIDVGTKQEIYRLMNEMVARGVSIIMISSEMEELIGMSDRIIVLHEGRMTGELLPGEYSQDRILELASGMED